MAENKSRTPDFIGLGAQKAGTSWIYACLHEHPEVYIPQKDIHFFSRERNWKNGTSWYQSIFSTCPNAHKTGEYSTSYLYDAQSPKRIFDLCSNTKLIVCLRNPVDRAYSNYINDIKAGRISKDVSFLRASKEHPEYLEQGLYAQQIVRYLEYFPKDRLLIMCYEDIKENPLGFIQEIYEFIGVSKDYNPAMLRKKINAGQVPKFLFIEKAIRTVSNTLKNLGLGRIVWLVKKLELATRLRKMNAVSQKKEKPRGVEPGEREILYSHFQADIQRLEEITGKSFKRWMA